MDDTYNGDPGFIKQPNGVVVSLEDVIALRAEIERLTRERDEARTWIKEQWCRVPRCKDGKLWTHSPNCGEDTRVVCTPTTGCRTPVYEKPCPWCSKRKDALGESDDD
jgi:hypothetical protein